MSFETAMRKQTVISDADAQAAGNPPQGQGNKKGLPCEHEERSYCADMKCHHKESGKFADWFAKRSVTLEKIHGVFSLGWSLLLLDSSLPAANREHCNSCVIQLPPGSGRR